MSKRKSFRRVKVWSCVPGKRLRMFSKPAPKAQTFGIMKKEAPASSAKADEGGVEQITTAVSASTITENGGFVK